MVESQITWWGEGKNPNTLRFLNMSLLFGVFSKLPIRPILDQLYAGIKHLPHETRRLVEKHAVGFGHALTYNTPEAVYETMPIYLPEARLIFVAEGRIDNREALAKALRLEIDFKFPDGNLMLKAYLKWGKDAPKFLQGDWSFACFHEDDQSLFLARDPHGYNALYYYYVNENFFFGSSIKSLLAIKNIITRLNVSKILGNYSFFAVKGEDTFYSNINLLSPGHTLYLKNGTPQVNRYWFPEHIRPTIRKDRAEYSQGLLEVLNEAISVRLRSYKPVASMLSGGLDSGTVAYLAAEAMKKQHAVLTTFSHVPLYQETLALTNENGWMLDESPNILATAKKSGNITPRFLNSSDWSPLRGIKKMVECQNAFVHGASNTNWICDILNQTHASGFGTLLTGENGNATISYTGVNYQLPIWHPSFRNNIYKLLKVGILYPMALKYFPSYFENKADGINSYVSQNLYLRPHVAEELLNTNKRNQNRLGFYTYLASAQAGMLEILDVGNNSRCEFGANSNRYFGIEQRDPTGDINVIQFCLSIPNDAFFDNKGNKKQVLKHMMKDLLPDQVLFQTKKGLQSADIVQRILAEKEEIAAYLNIISQNTVFKEFIDTKRLKADFELLSSSKNRDAQHPQAILKTIMLGCFLEENKTWI
jgi:asparagine synthase (glutamine-hydrolysing)